MIIRTGCNGIDWGGGGGGGGAVNISVSPGVIKLWSVAVKVVAFLLPGLHCPA